MSIQKDPNAVLDYAIDWSPWLATGETITSASWTVPTGMTQATPDPSHTDTVATIWLSGGTVGTSYSVTCHVTTSQGRQDDRSLTLYVNDR